MGDLTRNISRHEITCKCGCGFDTIDYVTIHVVQSIADIYWINSGPVTLNIHSGCRCLEYNQRIGSNETSQHIQGRAIDFSINDIDPVDIWVALNQKYPERFGIGKYPTFTHFDSRAIRARW